MERLLISPLLNVKFNRNFITIMINKILPFSGISLVVLSMALVLFIAPVVWIAIIALINTLVCLITLNFNHYKVLKKLTKYDKDFFEDKSL